MPGRWHRPAAPPIGWCGIATGSGVDFSRRCRYRRAIPGRYALYGPGVFEPVCGNRKSRLAEESIRGGGVYIGTFSVEDDTPGVATSLVDKRWNFPRAKVTKTLPRCDSPICCGVTPAKMGRANWPNRRCDIWPLRISPWAGVRKRRESCWPIRSFRRRRCTSPLSVPREMPKARKFLPPRSPCQRSTSVWNGTMPGKAPCRTPMWNIPNCPIRRHLSVREVPAQARHLPWNNSSSESRLNSQAR